VSAIVAIRRHNTSPYAPLSAHQRLNDTPRDAYRTEHQHSELKRVPTAEECRPAEAASPASANRYSFQESLRFQSTKVSNDCFKSFAVGPLLCRRDRLGNRARLGTLGTCSRTEGNVGFAAEDEESDDIGVTS
jgi:hypothetical protein